MPIFSFIKNLVGGQQQPSTTEHPAAAAATTATSIDTPNTPPVCEQSNHTDNSGKSNALTTAKPPLRPPPPMSTTPKNPSSRSKPPSSISDPNSSPKTRPPLTPVSGESLLRTESSSSVYRDFTGQGHADRGHWNDPPTTVFKPTNSTANGTANATANAAGGGAQDAEADADASLTEAGALESRVEMELSIRRILSERLQMVDTAEAMNRRVVEDTEKRLGVLWERMQLLDERLIAELNRLCALLDTDMHAEALGVYREVVKAYESELKWLVGIKRVIELSK